MAKYKYVFIPGAAKSGTTTLADELSRHANICVAKGKEPDFFARNYDKGTAWYESIFEDNQAIYRIDASTSYMAGFGGDSTEYLERIKKFDENAKFIFLVREPISRTWSSYWHAVRGGFEKLSFEKSISKPNCPHIEGSRYYARTCEFLKVFNQEQIMIVDFNRLVSNQSEVIKKVCEFIGVSYEFTESTETKQSNASFQWNGAGKILNVLPTPILKGLNQVIKSLVPQWFFECLKNSVSKPIPKINQRQIELVKELLVHDITSFEKTVEIDITLRSGKHWNDVSI